MVEEARSHRIKTFASVTADMPTTNPRELVRQNPGLRDEPPATKRLSHYRTAGSTSFKTSNRTAFFRQFWYFYTVHTVQYDMLLTKLTICTKYPGLWFYKKDIRYSLLYVSAVDSHLQIVTHNTFLRHNRASFHIQ